jgi:hypothetical protein
MRSRPRFSQLASAPGGKLGTARSWSTSSRSLWFERYNVAARLAADRRAEEGRAQDRRLDQAVAEVVAERRKVTAALQDHSRLKSPDARPDSQRTLEAAFEALRERAERDVVLRLADPETPVNRRPSWAPPLILEGELLAGLIELGFLPADATPIARLWAQFADSKKIGKYLREKVSKHTLEGVQCRGFELHAGPERQGSSAILFEAQKDTSGEWRIGPRFAPPRFHSNNQSQWERKVRERIRLQEDLRNPALAAQAETIASKIDALSISISEIERADEAQFAERNRHYLLRTRVVSLARARVLEFIGAADVQMAAAGRLCGQCCICWKTLTDPISLERGIGPECFHTGWQRRSIITAKA